MKFPFLGGAYTGRSTYANAQTCRNLMLEGDASTPDGNALVGTPGYSVQTASGTYAAEIRGMISQPDQAGGDKIWAVIGNRLYLYGAGTWARLDNVAGTTWALTSTTGRVSMAYMGLGSAGSANQNYAIAVADGVQFNYFSRVGAAETAANIATPSLVGNVVFLDGRFIASDLNNIGRFYYSGILSPATYTAFNFATAEGSPDALRSIFADRRELYLLGDLTTEVWYNAGELNNPFQRYQGGFIQTGCAARHSVARLDNTIVWLATDERGKTFVAILGPNYQPASLSTPQMNYLFSAYATTSDAFAMTYRQAGHECYVLTFPTQNITWVYDAVTKEWHQWGSGTSGRHIANCMATYLGKNIMATTAADGVIYELSPTVYTDNSAAIYRERTSHHVMAEKQRIPIAELRIDLDAGTSTTISRNSTLSASFGAGDASITTVATTSVAANETVVVQLDNGGWHLSTVAASAVATLVLTDPLTSPAASGNLVACYADDRFTMEWSKNGAVTFSTPTTLHVGTATNRDTWRAVVRKLGVAREWTLRFKTSAAIKIVIKGVFARLWGEA